MNCLVVKPDRDISNSYFYLLNHSHENNINKLSITVFVINKFHYLSMLNSWTCLIELIKNTICYEAVSL